MGGALALVVVFFFAWLSDRTNKRGFCVMGAQICYLITIIVARQTQPHVGPWSRWGLWTAVNAFAVGYHPIHNTCESARCQLTAPRVLISACTGVQLNCTDPRERSLSIAMWVMFAISGLMVGAQLFQGLDAPQYNNGLLYMMGLVIAGFVLAAVQKMVYLIHNKRVREGKGRAIHGEAEPRIYVP